MTLWPHGPYHNRLEEGLIMITAATKKHHHVLKTPTHRNILKEIIFNVAYLQNYEIHAYTVLPNHYHLLIHRNSTSTPLDRFVGQVHRASATQLNKKDKAQGRKVWFQYWDSTIKTQTQYLARINYVHRNAISHNLAKSLGEWDSDSYNWFISTTPTSFVETVDGISIDQFSDIRL